MSYGLARASKPMIIYCDQWRPSILDSLSFIPIRPSAARRLLLLHPPLPLLRLHLRLLPRPIPELVQRRLRPQQRVANEGGGSGTRKNHSKKPKKLREFRIFHSSRRIYRTTNLSVLWVSKHQIRHLPTFRIQDSHWKMLLHSPLPHWITIIAKRAHPPKRPTVIRTFRIHERPSKAHRHRTNAGGDCGAPNLAAAARSLVAPG